MYLADRREFCISRGERENWDLWAPFTWHVITSEILYTPRRMFGLADTWSLRLCAHKNSLYFLGSWPHSPYGIFAQERTVDLACPCGRERRVCQKQTCQTTGDRENKRAIRAREECASTRREMHVY